MYEQENRIYQPRKAAVLPNRLIPHKTKRATEVDVLFQYTVREESVRNKLLTADRKEAILKDTSRKIGFINQEKPQYYLID